MACSSPNSPTVEKSGLELIILGVAQDAGYPQTACTKSCCEHHYSGKVPQQFPTCLGIIDRDDDKVWMFEASPSYTEQWKLLYEASGFENKSVPDGIFLTHAHIGHYTGLMQLGHEVMGAENVAVYAMPRMKHFLEHNGPWSQLVDYKNIKIEKLKADSTISITNNFHVQPILVPHRDEYSETVGFKIFGPNKSVLFIPDIDKWQKWKMDIVKEVESVDYAFLDGTFYDNGELANRDMSQVPHPFIEESLEIFEALDQEQKDKIHFIHFNHTNPLIWNEAKHKELKSKGFQIAKPLQALKM